MRTHGRGSQRLTTGTGRGACSGSYQRHTYTAEEGKLLPHQGYVQKSRGTAAFALETQGQQSRPCQLSKPTGTLKKIHEGRPCSLHAFHASTLPAHTTSPRARPLLS